MSRGFRGGAGNSGGRLLLAYLALSRFRRIDREELLTAVYAEEATPRPSPTTDRRGWRRCVFYDSGSPCARGFGHQEARVARTRSSTLVSTTRRPIAPCERQESMMVIGIS